MQSDLSKLTPRTPPNETSDREQTRQHGLNTENSRGSSFLRSGVSLGEPLRSTLTAGLAASTAATHGEIIDQHQRLNPRLSPPRHKKPPSDRVSEHEKALSYTPRRRNEGPRFVVIPRKMAKSPDEINIIDFPNGVVYLHSSL